MKTTRSLPVRFPGFFSPWGEGDAQQYQHHKQAKVQIEITKIIKGTRSKGV